ncbi:hypothetical protein OROHE_012236 [Orobanche hederae]
MTYYTSTLPPSSSSTTAPAADSIHHFTPSPSAPYASSSSPSPPSGPSMIILVYFTLFVVEVLKFMYESFVISADVRSKKMVLCGDGVRDGDGGELGEAEADDDIAGGGGVGKTDKG